MSFLLENTTYANFIWFLLGGLGYQLVRTLSGYLELQSYVKTVNQQALYMILRAMEEKTFASNMKYRLLKENEFPSAVIEEMKRNDTTEMDAWKLQVLSCLHTNYPYDYLRTVDAEEWREKFVKKGRFR